MYFATDVPAGHSRKKPTVTLFNTELICNTGNKAILVIYDKDTALCCCANRESEILKSHKS